MENTVINILCPISACLQGWSRIHSQICCAQTLTSHNKHDCQNNCTKNNYPSSSWEKKSISEQNRLKWWFMGIVLIVRFTQVSHSCDALTNGSLPCCTHASVVSPSCWDELLCAFQLRKHCISNRNAILIRKSSVLFWETCLIWYDNLNALTHPEFWVWCSGYWKIWWTVSLPKKGKLSLENSGILALKTLLSWQILIAIFSTE